MRITCRQRGGRKASAPTIAFFALLAVCGTAQASTVIPMTITEMADLSGQVIIGEVASVRSYWADNPRRIESEVTLNHVEYLKGRLADSSSTFKLLVPGGTVDEWGLRIADAPVLAAGEKWVLFILPTYKTFPVVGLSQGGFRVQTGADGVERVHTAGLEPVKGVGSDGFVQVVGRDSVSVRQHLAAENGVRVKTTAQAISNRGEAMSLADFKAMIQPILNASKTHALEESAGRPVFGTPRFGLRLQQADRHASRTSAADRPGRQDKPTLRGADKAKQTAGTPRQPATEQGEARQ